MTAVDRYADGGNDLAVDWRKALRGKALGALREGRVTVMTARCGDQDTPSTVVARVQTSRPDSIRVYVVDLSLPGGWSCTCVGWQRENRCAHLLAVQMVTGYGVPA